MHNKFVIIGKGKDNNEKELYYAIDSYSGGVPYWATRIRDARLFDSADEANKILNNHDFTERQKMAGGDWDAPYMLRKLAFETNGKLNSDVTVIIAQIKIDFIPASSIHQNVFDIKAKPAWEI